MHLVPRAALSLALLLPTLALAQDSGERWEVPQAGVSLPIPDGWSRVEDRTGRTLLRRMDGAGAGFAENIGVNMGPGAETLEALQAEVTTEIEKGKAEILATSRRTIGDHTLLVLEFRGAVRGIRVHWLLAAFLQGEQRVVITAAVLDERWESSREGLDAMLSGMEISAPGQRKPRTRLVHPTSGVSIVPPLGWVQLPPGQNFWSVAGWALTRDGRQAHATLMLNAEPVPGDATSAALAQNVAQKVNGVVQGGELEVDGVAASIVEVENPQGQQPRRVLVCVKDGLAFTLFLQGPPPALDAWKESVRSWAWHEREDPTRHLSALGPPMALGGVVLRLPGLARFAGNDGGELRMGIHDYKASRGGLLVQLRAVGVQDESVTLEGLRDQLAQQIGSSLPEGTTLEWELRDAAVPGYLSTPVEGQNGQHLLFSVTRPSPGVAVLVNFIIYDPTPEARAAYREACRRILDRAAPAPPQPRRPPQDR